MRDRIQPLRVEVILVEGRWDSDRFQIRFQIACSDLPRAECLQPWAWARHPTEVTTSRPRVRDIVGADVPE